MTHRFLVTPLGLDHRLVHLPAILAESGLPALILSGQDGLATHAVADVGEGMIKARGSSGVRVRPDFLNPEY